MANKKITDLVEITSAADVDVLAIVDVSADTTNKIKVDNLPVSAPVQTALDAKQATLVSGTNIKTINSTSLLGSGDIAIAANPAGTAGQIQFSDGSAFAADSNLFWDNTNKRLGVGETTPTARVQVKGEGNTSSTTALLITNSDSTTNLFIKDNGDFYFGANNNTISGSSNNLFLTGNAIYFKTAFGQHKHTMTSAGLQLGGGSAIPTAMLQVKGSGSTSATTSLLVQNSSGTELLKVRDDNKIYLSGAPIVIDGNQIYNGNTSNGFLKLLSNRLEYSDTSSTAIEATAALTLTSTTRGFLPPRMTTTQKNAISSPAAGLQVYDSTTNRAAVYTSAWENVITETNGSPNSVYKLWSGSAAQYAALTPDSSTLYFVI